MFAKSCNAIAISHSQNVASNHKKGRMPSSHPHTPEMFCSANTYWLEVAVMYMTRKLTPIFC